MPAGLCKQCGEVEGGVEGVGGAMEGGLRPHPQLQAAIVAVRQQVKEEAGYEGGAVEAESDLGCAERAVGDGRVAEGGGGARADEVFGHLQNQVLGTLQKCRVFGSLTNF